MYLLRRSVGETRIHPKICRPDWTVRGSSFVHTVRTLSATLERSRRRSAVQLPVARRHRLAQRQRCEPTLKLAAAAAAAAAERGASQELLERELLSLRRLGCSLDRLG